MLAISSLLTQNNHHLRSTYFIALQLSVGIPITHIVLLSLGYARTSQLLTRMIGNPKPQKTSDPEAFAKNLRRLIRNLRKHHPLAGSCLSLSLCLWWLLQRRGIKTSLCIGTNNSDDFMAHAWLELDGHPLNAGAKVRQRYATFDKSFTPGYKTIA
ncbi:MAG: lasso peptide biosynthesis B2 protein [Gammaproteobacteria bacterium]|nr:lasso peptide biosynthesis B2 protein [Gammaproteobacteria bacterium]